MKYAYYPGCSLHSTAVEYDISMRAVAGGLDMTLAEIEDWSCCGATAAHTTNHMLSVALPARNLALTEQQGMKDVVIPCAACYNNLKKTSVDLQNDAALLDKTKRIIETEYNGTVNVLSPLEVLSDPEWQKKIKEKITVPLAGIKVASYYGCLLVRPQKVQFDDPEDPQSMDRIVGLIGAEALPWPFKTECCGASLSMSRDDLVPKLLNRLFASASEAGADCIAVACPLCHANLDMRQQQVAAAFERKYQLPVLYITQLIGLALGFSAKELGMEKHFNSAQKLLANLKAG